MFAFDDFWQRLSQLDKFNTCHWHSACTKFGGSNNFATLSHSSDKVLCIIKTRGRSCQYKAFRTEMYGKPQCGDEENINLINR